MLRIARLLAWLKDGKNLARIAEVIGVGKTASVPMKIWHSVELATTAFTFFELIHWLFKGSEVPQEQHAAFKAELAKKLKLDPSTTISSLDEDQLKTVLDLAGAPKDQIQEIATALLRAGGGVKDSIGDVLAKEKVLDDRDDVEDAVFRLGRALGIVDERRIPEVIHALQAIDSCDRFILERVLGEISGVRHRHHI